MIYVYIDGMKKPKKVRRSGHSIEMLSRMAQVLKLLAHPHRLKIVELLEAEAEAPVHRIVERVGLPQGATSQHLNQMRRVGLVRADRRGKEVWYAIADRRAFLILDCVCRSGK